MEAVAPRTTRTPPTRATKYDLNMAVEMIESYQIKSGQLQAGELFVCRSAAGPAILCCDDVFTKCIRQMEHETRYAEADSGFC